MSRMLKKARERGLVEIRVRSPLETAPYLQEELRARMGLRECLVLAADAPEPADRAGRMAALTARYLQDRVIDGSTLGVGWSRTIYRSVSSGYLRRKHGANVVQLMGSVSGSIPELNGISITARLAGALGATAYYLHAPMLVTDPGVRDGLLRDPNIRRTLEMARRADMMVVGIGAIDRDHGQYLTGYLDDADLEYIRGNGVVGDVCGVYFTLGGDVRHLEMNDRTVALDAESVRRIPVRVGVSWGPSKAVPNVGAARAGLVNVLITDEETAEEMLRVLEREGETERV